jgi:hypothetical protein
MALRRCVVDSPSTAPLELFQSVGTVQVRKVQNLAFQSFDLLELPLIEFDLAQGIRTASEVASSQNRTECDKMSAMNVHVF